MPTTIYYGTDQNALEQRCRENAIAAKQAVVIVPEQFSFHGETSFLRLQSRGVRVLTFRKFGRELFEKIGSRGEYIAGAAKLILMEQALQKCASRLTVYKNSIGKSGFADTLCKTVAELKHAEVSAEDLEKRSSEMTQFPYLQEKMRDLSVVFRQFNALTERAGWDADDDITRMISILPDPRLDELSGTAFLLFHFSGFTVQERKLIFALEQRIGELQLYVRTDTVTAAPDTKACFVSAVRNIEAMRVLSPRFCRVEGQEDPSELGFLQKQFFCYPAEKREAPPKQIRIFAAENPYDEVMFVASEILRLCREEGYRYRDIAVVGRSLGTYKKQIEQIFPLFDLCWFNDEKEPICTHPFVSFLLSVRDIFEYRWNYESVFHYAKSCFCPLPPREIDLFENFCLASGMFGNRLTDEALFSERLAKNTQFRDLKTQLEEIRRKLVEPLLRLRERTKGSLPFRKQAEELFSFLEEIGLYDRLTAKTEEFCRNGDRQKQDEYRQLWMMLLRVLDEVVLLCGEESGSFRKFMDLLEEAMGACKLSSPPQVLDSVTVSTADRFVGNRIKCLFVLGMNEGEFPAANVRGGLLDGVERDLLEQMGLELATSRAKAAYMEQEIIFKTFSLPQCRLYCSYRRADMDQNAKAPSHMIRRIRELFPSITEETELPAFSSAEYTFRRMLEDPARYTEAEPWFRAHFADRYAMLERAEDRSEITLSPETVNALYPNELNVSISRLELFQKCPFSFHATYHLKLRPRKLYRFEAPDAGTLIHSVLEESAKRIEASEELSWEKITREQCGDLVEEILRHEAIGDRFGGLLVSSSRYRYYTARIKQMLAKNLFYISKQFKNGNFRPIGYEISFHEDGAFPPVRMTSSDGKPITLSGKVDRADAGRTQEQEWLRIIDYKSGKKEFSLEEFYYGLNLQLITYLDALCEHSGKEPAGVFYFHAQNPYLSITPGLSKEEAEHNIAQQLTLNGLLVENEKVYEAMDDGWESKPSSIPVFINSKQKISTQSLITSEEFELLRQKVRLTLKQISNKIAQGQASVCPSCFDKEHLCRYCRFSPVCAFESKKGNYRKLDPLSSAEVINLLKEEFDV